ncbi:MAG: hypothetical protein INR71_00960, partial [Terriglobus roseus]|nr:hypothetical protein [Terriglobus roseus]
MTIILLNFILNKAPALYGMLAPLTGHPLNSLQAVMYVYSLPALALAVYCAPHLRAIPPSPLHSIAWAYLYIVDTLVNAAFTAAFGVAWFVVLAQHPHDNVPGADTIKSTSGFTSPQHNVTGVEVVAKPVSGILGGQEATAHGIPADDAAAAVQLTARGLTDAVFDRGSIMSITV